MKQSVFLFDKTTVKMAFIDFTAKVKDFFVTIKPFKITINSTLIGIIAVLVKRGAAVELFRRSMKQCFFQKIERKGLVE